MTNAEVAMLKELVTAGFADINRRISASDRRNQADHAEVRRLLENADADRRNLAAKVAEIEAADLAAIAVRDSRRRIAGGFVAVAAFSAAVAAVLFQIIDHVFG